jgi:thiol:disulfide interchange protein DsbD
MKHRLFFAVLLLLACGVAQATTAVPDAARISTEHATVTLLSERTRVTPGQTLWLGLRFELIPHWHVYWRNPGASGSAPVIRWKLPEGWEAGAIRWPVPKRIRVGPLTNYGYEDTVTFLVPMQVPEEPLPARRLAVTADAEWLVCREACIPESGRFTLGLNDPDVDNVTDTATSETFAATRKHWPEATTLTGRYRLDGDTLALSVGKPDRMAANPAEVWFAANQWGPVDASGVQRWQGTGAVFLLRVPTGDVPPTGNKPLEGLLVAEFEDSGSTLRQGYQVRLTAGPPIAEKLTPGLVAALVFALLGGLILNVMPCVLPVLGIKILGFVRETSSENRRLVLHGLIYAAGIMVSFGLLATTLLVLRAGGESLGWGFQLQSPLLVSLLAYLMLLVGLNLVGVFAVGSGLMGLGQSLTGLGGLFRSFATGVLAAVVASPCTAPFMGAALGFAITRPTWEALSVFLTLGAGFALPVLLLSLFPAWARFIPKPGPWMQRLQQLLAFPMFATAAWLLWVLSQQTEARAYGAALAGLVVVALAAWVYGQWHPRSWRLGLLGVGLTVALGLLLGPVAAPPDTSRPLSADRDERAWSEQAVQQLTAAGRPVFVNFTAAWCITCKVNERVALSTNATRQLFQSRSVAYLVADWTRRDPAISRQLERYGRSGVPLYLLYSPIAEQPRVLPQLLTEGIVAEAIQNL